MPQQVYMSHGAFIPPMVYAWCMHGPFVEHAHVPGHSHGLQNHPGGPQDDRTTPSSHHAWLPPSTLPPPLPSSPSLPSRTHCTPKCVPSMSPGAWQHNIIHMMNSSGSAHETRRSGSIHLCHQRRVPLPTQTLSPFAPAHPSHHAHHADQPTPHPILTSPKSMMWTLSTDVSMSASSPCAWLMAPHQNPPSTCRPSLQNLLRQNWVGCTCCWCTSVHCRCRWGRTRRCPSISAFCGTRCESQSLGS